MLFADPILGKAAELEKRADDLHKIDTALANLCRLIATELRKLAAEIADYPVPYPLVAEATGYNLGSLQNNKLENVGTRGQGAFRLGDLPFKAGSAGPARQYLAMIQAQCAADEQAMAAQAREELARRIRSEAQADGK
jgi:hypothetical protein